MSFPLVEPASPSPLGKKPTKLAEQVQAEPAAQVQAEREKNPSYCPACGGAGVWRGIDGFEFHCHHCPYEMT
jgi:hypothetical protein